MYIYIYVRLWYGMVWYPYCLHVGDVLENFMANVGEYTIHGYCGTGPLIGNPIVGCSNTT